MISWNNFENSAAVTMTKQKIGIGQGRFYLTSIPKKLCPVRYSQYFAVHSKDISR